MIEAIDAAVRKLGSVTLVWMPAHQSIATIGEGKLSNGQRLSALDWRANRFVDVLAPVAVRAHGAEGELRVHLVLHHFVDYLYKLYLQKRVVHLYAD